MTLLTPHQYFHLKDARPRKRFGQNFLNHAATAERIVKNAELSESDTAIEVGPGLGALTGFIVPLVKRLHLVELDRDLAQYLRENIPEPHVVIHQQDVLTFDFTAVMEEEVGPSVILGNLPYNITSPLLFRILESARAVKRSVFMVQKEVGDRLTARPGSKEYGVLSVLLGACATVSRLFTVGPQQFYPPPRVESLVVRFDFLNDRLPTSASFAALRRVVNVAFQQRRKTLLNSLSACYEKKRVEAALGESGIDPGLRPEVLGTDAFMRLSGILTAGDEEK